MSINHINRRKFVQRAGQLTTAGMLVPSFAALSSSCTTPNEVREALSISTEFLNGGGSVSLVNRDPVTLRLKPHNQNDGGWGQVWWYFKLGGVSPGEEVTIQLEIGNPKISGISPKANYTYDQINWGLTNQGEYKIVDGLDLFEYNHLVRNDEVWFAYDLPYTPHHYENQLLPKAARDNSVAIFEFCKTVNGRSVQALTFRSSNKEDEKYGIWLQARSHAFESGGSWVLHHLAEWLLSKDSKARALRELANITIIPIVDLDGVVEGRTGKMQEPYDHNRGWDQNPGQWPEIRSIKKRITESAHQNMTDMFIDFHGPGGESHPYFIVPVDEDLPKDHQRLNRARFFEVLEAKPLTDEMSKTQSMTQICFSARPSRINKGDSTSWVLKNASDNVVALAIEVNMNTALSTIEGYRSEATVLGRAISDYFVAGLHQK